MNVYIKDGIERLLYASDVVALATFRCPLSSPFFRDSGPPHDDVIVFPRRIVKIEHHRGPAFVADPTIVPLYNRGQRFSTLR